MNNGYRYNVPPRTPGAIIEPPPPPTPDDGPAYWALPDHPYDATPIVHEQQTPAPAEHNYVSPDCWHGHHDQCGPCDNATGPAACTFCNTTCTCTCHHTKEAT